MIFCYNFCNNKYKVDKNETLTTPIMPNQPKTIQKHFFFKPIVYKNETLTLKLDVSEIKVNHQAECSIQFDEHNILSKRERLS